MPKLQKHQMLHITTQHVANAIFMWHAVWTGSWRNVPIVPGKPENLGK